MRIRRKPWARPELLASSLFVADSYGAYGRWGEIFRNENPIWLELGCGKGDFARGLSERFPERNLLLVDVKSEMLAMARRKIEPQDADPAACHVRLVAHDIERIGMMISPEDRIERVYINFCNPWPKERDKKHRLTHPRQLQQYRRFLPEGGEIWCKTDNDELFRESLAYFAEAGFEVVRHTWDLGPGEVPDYPDTEHERMFRAEGIPIKFLIAVKRAEVSPGTAKDAADGSEPRSAEGTACRESE